MYTARPLPEGRRALLYQCTWLVDRDREYDELTISETARLTAPEGKFITLTVDGMGRELKPGHYVGPIRLSLSDGYLMAPHGLMNANRISRLFQTAVCVENGRLSAEKGIPALLTGGRVDDRCMEDVYIGAAVDSLNGVVIAGDSEYTLNRVRMDLDGFGDNDFLGVGSAVTVIDRARVTVNDCRFTMSGVTRCAVHVGGDSEVTFNRCEMENHSPQSDWLGFFSWQIGLLGTNRLTQLTDNARVTYNDCRLKTNGWGICSIDGSDEGVEMTLRGCRMELSGPRTHGYGAFCIGENTVTLDHTRADVNGYPLMLMGMQGLGRASILNGSEITGRRFGVLVVGDDDSLLTLADSDFRTGKSCLCVKGSATTIDIRACRIEAGNNVILQLMDTDEAGMTSREFLIPVGEADTPIPGRSLTQAVKGEDILLTLRDMELRGDLFNSTTNLRAYARGAKGGPGAFHDTLVGPVPFFDAPPPDAPQPPDHRGPKNLSVTLRAVSLTGRISAAGQAYREWLTRITEENRLEMSNVTQWPQEPVNNGVIVSLDAESRWTVTGDSWLTALELEEGAILCAPEGKTLRITVDGVPVEPAPGRREGQIHLRVD